MATLHVLYSYIENPNSKIIYAIPLISLLWVNLHGGSAVLVYLLCGLFLAVSLLPIKHPRINNLSLTKKQKQTLFIVTIVASVAMLINPNGIHTLLYPYLHFSERFHAQVILEWFPPDAKDTTTLIFGFIPIAAVTMAFILSNKKIEAIDLALHIVFTYFFLRSIRYMAIYYVVSGFFAFKYMPTYTAEQLLEELRISKRLAKRAILFLSFAFLVAVLIISTMRLQNDNPFIGTHLSPEAVEFIRNDNPQRLFNSYNMGGDLMYHGIYVFFDGRADFYTFAGVLQDGVHLIRLEGNSSRPNLVQYMLDKYGIDSFAIHPYEPLATYLRSHPTRFTLLFECQKVSYFRVICPQMRCSDD